MKKILTRLFMAQCMIFSALLHYAADSHAAAQKFVFISHAPDTDVWWNTIRNALKQVSEDFDIVVDYKNPKTGDIHDMVRLIEESSRQNYQGMIVTLADYVILKDSLAEIVKQKRMPLITVNSGTQMQSEAIGAIMHIGQPETLAGQKAGEKARRAKIRSFVCLNHYARNPASHERCKGFATGLGEGATYVPLELEGSDVEMQAKIETYLNEYPNTQALLALGPTSAHPALVAIKALKSRAKPYFATFDLSGQISDGIKSGIIAFAIDQQPYFQGYLPAALLAGYNKAPDVPLDFVKIGVFINEKLLARMSRYGLDLRLSRGRHINSGPALITKFNIEKVDIFSGTYR